MLWKQCGFYVNRNSNQGSDITLLFMGGGTLMPLEGSIGSGDSENKCWTGTDVRKSLVSFVIALAVRVVKRRLHHFLASYSLFPVTYVSTNALPLAENHLFEF